MDRQEVVQRSGEDSVGSGVCGGFVRICILRAILFLAHQVLLGGAWGGAGELMPLDGAGGRKGPRRE